MATVARLKERIELYESSFQFCLLKANADARKTYTQFATETPPVQGEFFLTNKVYPYDRLCIDTNIWQMRTQSGAFYKDNLWFLKDNPLYPGYYYIMNAGTGTEPWRIKNVCVRRAGFWPEEKKIMLSKDAHSWGEVNPREETA